MLLSMNNASKKRPSPDCGLSTEAAGFEGLVKYTLFVSANVIMVIHSVYASKMNEHH